MTDVYTSFAHLERHETHGRDFRVRAIERLRSPVAILAPHGGGIEIGTSQLADVITLAVHGCKGESQIYLGGLDEDLKSMLTTRLKAAGFPATTEGHRYQGRNPLNICNRGLRGRGAQIELTRDFREPAARQRIAPLVHDVLADYLEMLTTAKIAPVR